MPITIQEIAKQSDVSPGAVSQILREPGHRRFASETRKRVLEKAKELGYVQNRMAGGLRGGRSHTLSLVIPHNTPELMDVAERVAGECGYGLMVYFTPEPEVEAERHDVVSALERRTDGLLWMPSSAERVPNSLIKQIQQSHTRVVLLEERLPQLRDADLVEFDYRGACDQAVSHLVQAGYPRIVFLTHENDRHVSRRVMGENFLTMAKRREIRGELLLCENSSDARPELDRLLVEVGPEPIGFLCDHDWYALDVLRRAQAMGLDVPKQVGIITVGDLLLGNRVRLGELTNPSISSLPRPFTQMARQGIEWLVRRLNRSLDEPAKVVRLPMQLCVRQSTLRQNPV